MILKVEKLMPDSVVRFTRNGKQQQALVGTLIYDDEISTLVVERGTVIYSVNEQELVTKSADVKEPPKSVVVEDTVTTVDTPAPAVAKVSEPAKKVVFPGKKK